MPSFVEGDRQGDVVVDVQDRHQAVVLEYEADVAHAGRWSTPSWSVRLYHDFGF